MDKLTRSCCPKLSFPTRPTIFVGMPRPAAATAWFAPLPPPAVKKLLPLIVYPGVGKRGVVAIKSMLTLPKIIMLISY